MFMEKNDMQLFLFKAFCMRKLVAIVSVVRNSKQLFENTAPQNFPFFVLE
jgi:hypothetical protein